MADTQITPVQEIQIQDLYVDQGIIKSELLELISLRFWRPVKDFSDLRNWEAAIVIELLDKLKHYPARALELNLKLMESHSHG